MQLSGKRILITGGSSGMRKATAALLTQAGATVLITGRDEAKLKATTQELGIEGVAADLSTQQGVAQTIAAVEQKLGGIDVLINNAGIGAFDRIEDVSWEAYERVFATNVFGPALLTAGLVPALKRQGSGTIINIASTASLKGFALGSIYSASKFALRSMTECWQAELRKFNIRVCQVNPSEVTTAFGQDSREPRPDQDKKLRAQEIAHTIKAILELDDRAMVPEVTVWATNPF